MDLARPTLRFLLLTYFALLAFNLLKNSPSRALDLAEHLQAFQAGMARLTGFDSSANIDSAFLVAHSHLLLRSGSLLLFVVSVAGLVFPRTLPAVAGLLYLVHKALEHRFLDAYFDSAVQCEPLFEAVSLFVLGCLLTAPSPRLSSPRLPPAPSPVQAKAKKAG